MKIAIAIIMSGLLVTGIVISSCQKDASPNNNPDSPHAIKVFLTDHQTPVFDSVFIDLQKLEVKVEDDTLSNGGWVTLAIRQGVYNILRFRNGLDTLFATGTLPSARIKKIRLTLGTQNSVMKDGQSFPLTVHDNDREVVVDVQQSNFEIVSPGQVIFWIDFDAGRSIDVDNSGPGNNNGYRLRSSIKLFSRSNSGRIKGKVLPRQADAIVMAIAGADTATAIPGDDDGEFRIVGLTAGTYRVFIDGNNGFKDTTVQNVVVRNGEDTRLPVLTLRQ